MPEVKEFCRPSVICKNEIHYAIHGKTAAEMINERVDADKPFLGLTNFKGKYITARDIGIAKNYLSEEAHGV